MLKVAKEANLKVWKKAWKIQLITDLKIVVNCANIDLIPNIPC